MRRTGDVFIIGGLLLGAAALFAFVYLLMNGYINLHLVSDERPPVPIGYERQVGDIAISVTTVLRPADSYLLQLGLSGTSANNYANREDEELALVYLRIRCVVLTK